MIGGADMVNEKTIKNAVIVVKPESMVKTDLETMCRQIAQITTACVLKDVYVEEIIVTYNGIKDITKKVKSLTEHKEIQLLLVYNAKKIAAAEREYLEFVDNMKEFYGIKVISYR